MSTRVSVEDEMRLERLLRALGFGVGEYAWPMDYVCDDAETYEFVLRLVERLMETEKALWISGNERR